MEGCKVQLKVSNKHKAYVKTEFRQTASKTLP
jgi:hypothetical protein